MNQWLKFLQFFLGTVVLGLITTAVTFYIQNKEVEIKELEQLGTFVNHAIDENVAVRLRFAQYFASVSKSKSVRARWKAYEKLLLKEKQEEEQKLQSLENEKEKVSELETRVVQSTKDIKELKSKIASLSSADNLDQASALKEQVLKKEKQLRDEIAKRFELEQSLASVQSEIQQSKNNLIYQRAPGPKTIERPERRGWVYLGDYNESKKHWTTQYFSHRPNAKPESLEQKVLLVRTRSINVRSDKPSIFGKFGNVIDVLNSGQEVKTLKVSKWQNSSYIWAEVLY